MKSISSDDTSRHFLFVELYFFKDFLPYFLRKKYFSNLESEPVFPVSLICSLKYMNVNIET